MNKFSNMKLRYKIGVGVATTAAIVGGASAAFAYITGGNGTGTGTAGTVSTVDHTVTPSATASGVLFDGTSTAVPITLTNNDKYSQQVASVSMTINTGAASWGTAKCPTDSFALTGSPSGAPWTVPAQGTTTVNGYSINFVDKSGEDQTGCVGFTVPFSLTAS